MANLVAATNNFIEISLDDISDFDSANDLIGLGLSRNPIRGLMVHKIIFVPSAVGDTVVVRDGANGPRIFTAQNVLGTYDILRDIYLSANRPGKLMTPYIHANECTIGINNSAFLIFELV